MVMNREQRRAQQGNGHGVPVNVPLLGGGKPLSKARSGAQINSLARSLDKDGTFEVELTQGPDGMPVPKLDRSQYMDADDLLAEIRAIVREELAPIKEQLREVLAALAKSQ